ncbi:MAG TPA: hydrogenase, partial [Acidobacteriaceae bacterium]
MATRDLSTNDPMLDPITGEVVVIAPGHSFKSVTEKISRIVLTAHTPVGWFFGFLVAGGIVMLLLTCLTWLFL